jgi:hypothetical protein
MCYRWLSQRETNIGREERSLIKKLCKNCNQPFETSNPEKRSVVISAELLFLEEKMIEYFYNVIS